MMNNNINANITYIIIFHKDFKKIVEYVNKVRDKINENIPIFFIYDNILSDNEINSIRSGVNIFHWENKGKLKSILNVMGDVETKFFKIIDGDDCLNIEKAIKLNKKLKNAKDDVFHFHTAAKIFNDNKNYGLQTTDKKTISLLVKESKDVFYFITPNAKAIYNTEIFREVSKYSEILTRQNYFNDVLLTIINTMFTRKSKGIKIKPYIQYHQFGQTRNCIDRNNNAKDLIDVFKNISIIIERTKKFQSQINERINKEELTISMIRQMELRGIKKDDEIITILIRTINKIYGEK